jgi:[NiFe] hydrogenase diaphorase moiety small subunit
MNKTLIIDGKVIPFDEGQTIMQAATAAGVYIPHLCHHPKFSPHGSCKLCTVKVNGRNCSACTFPAAEGQTVTSITKELDNDRKKITQMLFVEGQL